MRVALKFIYRMCHSINNTGYVYISSGMLNKRVLIPLNECRDKSIHVIIHCYICIIPSVEICIYIYV